MRLRIFCLFSIAFTIPYLAAATVEAAPPRAEVPDITITNTAEVRGRILAGEGDAPSDLGGLADAVAQRDRPVRRGPERIHGVLLAHAHPLWRGPAAIPAGPSTLPRI